MGIVCHHKSSAGKRPYLIARTQTSEKRTAMRTGPGPDRSISIANRSNAFNPARPDAGANPRVRHNTAVSPLRTELSFCFAPRMIQIP